MKIAVLSGKGGTGKTFVSVNLAASVPGSTYIDCDVEEPNGRLFLKPQNVRETDVCTTVPSFDAEACTGCRACISFCRFHALAFIKGLPKVFPDVCHACGGCALVCPQGAVREIPRPVGILSEGMSASVRVITGILNTGEASGVPVIAAARRAGAQGKQPALTVIDCPPGSSCSVMEAVQGADLCLLVTEPTSFGFHNFKMVHRLTQVMHLPAAVLLNKADHPYPPLEAYCAEQHLPLLASLPFSRKTAALLSAGQVAVREDAVLREQFEQLYRRIGEVPA